jgi:hypothetical protein
VKVKIGVNKKSTRYRECLYTDIIMNDSANINKNAPVTAGAF